MASDVNAEGVPAVFFADTATAPVLGQEAPGLPFWLLPGGGGDSLSVVLVVLVEIAVLYHAEAGGGAEVLTAAFVLLDGLVQRPQLAQQGHVLLTQAHLEMDSTKVSAGVIVQLLIIGRKIPVFSSEKKTLLLICHNAKYCS